MAKKEVIIVVPGVKGLSEWPYLVRYACLRLCEFFDIHAVYKDHLKTWEGVLGSKENKPLWLHWSRNPDAISKYIAVGRLQKLIHRHKRCNIKLVGISVGGEIILEAIKKSNNKNVKKAILVCSINEENRIATDRIKIVNIYSSGDSFAEAAIEAYSLFKGSKKLKGNNVVNINLPRLDHSDFCSNSKIAKGKYKGKRPSDVVNEFLREN